MPIARLVGASGAELLRLWQRPPTSAVRYAACIPARNEARHVARCLEALTQAFGPDGHVVLVINDTDDGTFEDALEALESADCGATIVDIGWRAGRGSAPRARSLAFAIASQIAPDARLYSTDADTIVGEGLRHDLDRAFAGGFDMVCGRIGFIPEEAAALPPVDPQRDAAIQIYRDASRHLRALAFPDPDNPWPHHGNIGGANFAVTARAYRRTGPLPLVPFGEDRALRRLFEAHGLRIRYSDAALVQTSCRLDSLTENGLSAELARNRREADPLVDEALEPPSRLLARLRLRHAVEFSPDRAAVVARLIRSGLEAERARAIGFMEPRTMGWYLAECELWGERPRMRFSELARHLPALLRLERRAEEALRGNSPDRVD